MKGIEASEYWNTGKDPVDERTEEMGPKIKRKLKNAERK
jgi:hypothetical protein